MLIACVTLYLVIMVWAYLPAIRYQIIRTCERVSVASENIAARLER